MSQTTAATARLGDFVSDAAPPDDARARAATAILDTVGVTLAGVPEPEVRTGAVPADAADQVDRHVVRRGERGAQRVRPARRQAGDGPRV